MALKQRLPSTRFIRSYLNKNSNKNNNVTICSTRFLQKSKRNLPIPSKSKMLLLAVFIVMDLLPILWTITCISSNLELFRYYAPKFQQETYSSFIELAYYVDTQNASYDVDHLVITACYLLLFFQKYSLLFLVFTMSFFGLFHHS